MRLGETHLSIPLLKGVSKVWYTVIIPCASKVAKSAGYNRKSGCVLKSGQGKTQ
jgi:hypothetical protein